MARTVEAGKTAWLVSTMWAERTCGFFDVNLGPDRTMHFDRTEALRRLFALPETFRSSRKESLDESLQMEPSLEEFVAAVKAEYRLVRVVLDEDKDGAELRFPWMPLHPNQADQTMRITFHRFGEDREGLLVRVQGWGLEKCDCFFGVLQPIPADTAAEDVLPW